jgi:hypothetical protein
MGPNRGAESEGGVIAREIGADKRLAESGGEREGERGELAEAGDGGCDGPQAFAICEVVYSHICMTPIYMSLLCRVDQASTI